MEITTGFLQRWALVKKQMWHTLSSSSHIQRTESRMHCVWNAHCRGKIFFYCFFSSQSKANNFTFLIGLSWILIFLRVVWLNLPTKILWLLLNTSQLSSHDVHHLLPAPHTKGTSVRTTLPLHPSKAQIALWYRQCKVGKTIHKVLSEVWKNYLKW